MDGLRHVIEDVNHDHVPRTGFETGRIYSGVRAVVPVWHTGEEGQRDYIGALEAGTSFDVQLQHLDRQIGAGFAVLLEKQHIEEAVWDEYLDLSGMSVEEGCRCYLEASSRDEVTQWIQSSILKPLVESHTRSELLEWDGKSWHLTRFALRDYLGGKEPQRAHVGSLLIWRDKSDELAAMQAQRWRNMQVLILVYLLAMAGMMTLLWFVRHGLQRRVDKAVAALRESETILNHAQAMAHLGSWKMVFPNGELYWSPETYQIFGMEPDTPADYQHFLSLIHPDDRPHVDAAWHAALRGAPYDIEHRIIVNGEIRWVREIAELAFAGDGELLTATGMVQDITEIKQIELELRTSEERYRMTFAAIKDGMWEWDVPSGKVVWDARCYTMLGYPVNAFPVELDSWKRLIHPDDVEQAYREVDRQLLAGESFLIEFRYRCADGDWLWVQGRGKVVAWQDGQPLRVVGTHSDISERKQAEQALQQAGARLATGIESFHGGILLEDENNNIILVNQTFCDLFVIPESPEALVGHNSNKLAERCKACFTQPAHFIQRIHEILAQRKAVIGEEIDLDNGRTLEQDYLPINSDGEFLGDLWLYRDISERKARERELRRLATTDTLTGLPNRRYFLEHMGQEISRYQRYQAHSAVLMLDIDYFKSVNDNYGHAAGDAVLRQFAGIVQQSLRKVDLAGRLGGEEFAILLPGSDREGALTFAERLRKQVEESPCLHEGESIAYTVSIGIAMLNEQDKTCDQPLSRADARLYLAKQNGRNRVEYNPESSCIG